MERQHLLSADPSHYRAAKMSRRVAIVIACSVTTVVAVFTWPQILYRYRLAQFESAQRLVESHGGTLCFDLVDGNYVLELNGSAATDESVDAILPTLVELPTGLTLFGPGEDRGFWLTLSDSQISDSGLESLLALHVTFLTLDCAYLTEHSARTISQLEHSYVRISPGTRFSNAAMSDMQASLGHWLITPQESQHFGETQAD